MRIVYICSYCNKQFEGKDSYYSALACEYKHLGIGAANMPNTIKEVVERIKKVGVENTRIIPKGNTVQIQVKVGNDWLMIMENVAPGSADDIIRQASSRVILG